MPEWRDLLLVEGGAGSDRTMASALQHGAAAFVARLQATGATSYLAEGNGAWRYGKRCAFPTSPHPRLRLRTRLEKGATLTFHLVQKIGQVIRFLRSLYLRFPLRWSPQHLREHRIKLALVGSHEFKPTTYSRLNPMQTGSLCSRLAASSSSIR